MADGDGCVAAVFGDPADVAVARAHELAEGYDWSEDHRGTNEIGTALVDGSAVVTGTQHWRADLAEFAGVGVAVSDPDGPVSCAVVALCVHRQACPSGTFNRLCACVREVCARLRVERVHETAVLLAALHEARSHTARSAAVLDRTGVLLASEARDGDEDWLAAALDQPAGSALVRLADRSVALAPVRHDGRFVGALLTAIADDGESGVEHAPVTRVAGTHGGHVLLVAPAEIRLAHAEDKTVWLHTDRGMLRALDHTLTKVAGRLAPHGFVRVHRGCVVNLHRVREIAPTFRGGVVLVLDGPDRETVPVSRRCAVNVRHALGVLT
ncbi:MAG TPA: LytTR family transcriptional regulator DNA-binding domain-containing protein [Pseudonocardiaceae bacterium]|nr:LytTR family transcriptional regulator DNA-binding domain-containing protein [Pseudonocardiaceae bacterium]